MSFLHKIRQNSVMIRVFRTYCTKAAKSDIKIDSNTKSYGQPHYKTHPHLLKKGEVTPLITKTEFQTRRDILVRAAVKHGHIENSNHMIVIPSASKKYMSDKIPYVFRQNTDFLYLTGCLEPDCCLVITITDKSPRIRFFTRDRDEHAELWDGPRTDPQTAISFFGVDESHYIGDLEKFLNSYAKRNPNLVVWFDRSVVNNRHVHLLMQKFEEQHTNSKWENPLRLLHFSRLFKSPAEITLMQKACDITSEAFIKAMSASKPGIGENQLFAIVDYESRMRGAEYLAYPPVVAGGPRATTIHYIDNNQIVNDFETVLMDAGCEYHGYASDITRTWPVNGRFTEPQRLLYEVVYDVQQEIIHMCGQHPSLHMLFNAMLQLLGKRLQEAGIFSNRMSGKEISEATFELCPHHVSHYLGMDVHDTPLIARGVTVQPGMVITVEPGIYVNQSNKLVEKKYHGIGVRIEDDVLITESGPVVLSRNCPKHIDDIEKIVNSKSAA